MTLDIKKIIWQLALCIFYFVVVLFSFILSFIFNQSPLIIVFIGLVLIFAIIRIVQASINLNSFLKIRDELDYKSENNIELTANDKLRIYGKVIEIKNR